MIPWDDRFEAVLRARLPLLGEERPLLPDTALREVGLNSMKIMSLLVHLEKEYGGTFSDDALTFEAFATPGRLWELVREQLLPAGDAA